MVKCIYYIHYAAYWLLLSFDAKIGGGEQFTALTFVVSLKSSYEDVGTYFKYLKNFIVAY